MSVHRGGLVRYPPLQAGTPPSRQAPLPSRQTPPPSRQTPPPGRHPPSRQAPPPLQADPPPPLQAGTPPPGRPPSPPPGRHPPPGIRSTLGRYASYWNAFLYIERNTCIANSIARLLKNFSFFSCLVFWVGYNLAGLISELNSCHYHPQCITILKVIFSRVCVKNSVGGGCLPQCMLGYTPLGRHLLDRHPNPPGRHPLGRPPGQTTPWADPPGRHPSGRPPQADIPPASTQLLMQMAHILLECILVTTHKRSLGQGNIFAPVCHSVHREGSASVHAGTRQVHHPPGTRQAPPRTRHYPPGPGRHPPGPGRHPPGPSRHPPPEHTGRYGQQAGGMHPTGMQSFFPILHSKAKRN